MVNRDWKHPASFSSRDQLAHLAIREKARRHRSLVRSLLDSGTWGSVCAGRAALAEGGEKIAAAARFCELQVRALHDEL